MMRFKMNSRILIFLLHVVNQITKPLIIKNMSTPEAPIVVGNASLYMSI